jgi:branched-chain amino acid transport system permease protein
MLLFIEQCLNGLQLGLLLFLMAAGLTLVFGIMDLVNLAHGSLYMLGAYLALTFMDILPVGVLGFWGAVAVASLAVGVIGVVIEVVVLRRIYHAPELFQLVATFGIVLIIQDAALYIWGPQDRLGPRAPGLDGVVRILGEPIPEYDLALIVIGPLVLGLIFLLFNRTRWGVLVRAATEDREMVGALGVKQSVLFTTVFFLGAALAGLGGALQIPRQSVTLFMDLNVIADVFVVVVIGGLGSVWGAFVAAVLISELNAFGILFASEVSLVLPFAVMAVVLVFRPFGLFGTPESGEHAQTLAETPMRPLPGPARVLLLAGIAVLAAVPLIAGDFAMTLLTEVLIVSLFAASLHFMMGPGGMASFGHAAFFGIGAYAVAFFITRFGLPMLPSLLIAPLATALAAFVIGWFCVRRSGVYLAMLTLAAAQIVWSVVWQWREVTGGDDGMLGVWPARWASSREAFYLLTLAVVVAALAAIRTMAHAPFGYALRAARDSPLRAESIGIDVNRQQWAAFVVAGMFAGLAGAAVVLAGIFIQGAGAKQIKSKGP